MITVNQNSYVSVADYLAWREQRGFDDIPEVEAEHQLIGAMDWLEVQRWTGEKQEPDQPLQFPRSAWPNEVPKSIQLAQMWLAYYSGTYDLWGAGESGKVTSKSEGDLSVSYASGVKWNALTAFPSVASLLDGWLRNAYVIPLIRA